MAMAWKWSALGGVPWCAWRRRGVACVGSVLLGTAGGCEEPHGAGDIDQHVIMGAARVIDGDGLQVGEVEVRLAGIDACEIEQTAEGPTGEWPCGLVARDRLEALTAGRDVTCLTQGVDLHDRQLARCYVGKQELGPTMLREGLAVAYRYGGQPTVKAFTEHGLTARREQRGLWAGEFEEPRAFRSRNRR